MFVSGSRVGFDLGGYLHLVELRVAGKGEQRRTRRLVETASLGLGLGLGVGVGLGLGLGLKLGLGLGLRWSPRSSPAPG